MSLRCITLFSSPPKEAAPLAHSRATSGERARRGRIHWGEDLPALQYEPQSTALDAPVPPLALQQEESPQQRVLKALESCSLFQT